MTGDREEISLYFHIPFCSKKCPYCHFFVLPDQEELKTIYLEAIRLEWEMRLPSLQGKRIVSIYFGGGTPTRLSTPQIASLLTPILDLELAPDCEITLEANPEDITLSRMQELRLLGINRLSIGIQSLEEEELITLKRSHTSSKASEAIHTAFQAGFTNLSIDLMFELPKQTLVSWERTLKKLEQLPISHLSLYNLTLEPNTPFYKQKSHLIPQLPPEEEKLAMLQQGIAAISSLGLTRYEISAFARPGSTSRHNTGYWTGRPFLGFGPSAFSYWEKKRFRNIAHLSKYQTALNERRYPIDFEETLPYPHNLHELFAVQLRLVEGVDLALFSKRHAPLPPTTLSLCQKLIEEGYLETQGNTIRLTSYGQLFYDTVASELI
jgi:oxygen-independent coproporphyrinogen-3 oxidase